MFERASAFSSIFHLELINHLETASLLVATLTLLAANMEYNLPNEPNFSSHGTTVATVFAVASNCVLGELIRAATCNLTCLFRSGLLGVWRSLGKACFVQESSTVQCMLCQEISTVQCMLCGKIAMLNIGDLLSFCQILLKCYTRLGMSLRPLQSYDLITTIFWISHNQEFPNEGNKQGYFRLYFIYNLRKCVVSTLSSLHT